MMYAVNQRLLENIRGFLGYFPIFALVRHTFVHVS